MTVTGSSFKIWCEIVCDQCAKAANGQFNSYAHIPKKQMMLKAIAEGYIFKAGKVYCSTTCEQRAKHEDANRSKA